MMLMQAAKDGVKSPAGPAAQPTGGHVSATGQVDDRAWVERCAGAREDARRLSGAGSGVCEESRPRAGAELISWPDVADPGQRCHNCCSVAGANRRSALSEKRFDRLISENDLPPRDKDHPAAHRTRHRSTPSMPAMRGVFHELGIAAGTSKISFRRTAPKRLRSANSLDRFAYRPSKYSERTARARGSQRLRAGPMAAALEGTQC
jgi:hypothetical protein